MENLEKYKILVGKNHKKHTIIFSASSEQEARKKVHNDWYTILNIEKLNNFDDLLKWNFYFFEWIKNWIKKTWKIIWTNDIFKSYLSLRDSLGYEVLLLYSQEDKKLSLKFKKDLLSKLEEQYSIYKDFSKTKIKIEESEKLKNDIYKDTVNIDKFYMKKELDIVYSKIDFILEKLKLIIDSDSNWDPYYIEEQEKFRKIYYWIIKIRSSTNISKLKEIWELALVKIWEYEFKLLEKKKDIQSKDLLKDTNKLLKKLGSKKQFIEKDKDINYLIKNNFKNVWTYFDWFLKKKDDKKENIDKSSYDFLNLLIKIKKLKEKKNSLIKDILKSFYIFILPFWKFNERREDFFLILKILNQNIAILISKRDWKISSYTRIVKGYNKLFNNIFSIFVYISNYMFYVILLYALLFVFLLNFSFFSSYYNIDELLNIKGIFYFIFFILLYFWIHLSKNFIFLAINFLLIFLIFVLGTINF